MWCRPQCLQWFSDFTRKSPDLHPVSTRRSPGNHQERSHLQVVGGATLPHSSLFRTMTTTTQALVTIKEPVLEFVGDPLTNFEPKIDELTGGEGTVINQDPNELTGGGGTPIDVAPNDLIGGEFEAETSDQPEPETYKPQAKQDPSDSNLGINGAEIYCLMRNMGNDHQASWKATYALIQDRYGGISPEHAALMITDAVVRDPGSYPNGGQYLGDLDAGNLGPSKSFDSVLKSTDSSDSNSFNSTYSSENNGWVNPSQIDLIPDSAQIQSNFRLEIVSLARSVDSFKMKDEIYDQYRIYQAALSTVPADDYREIAGLMLDAAYNVRQIFASTGVDDERNPASSLTGLAADYDFLAQNHFQDLYFLSSPEVAKDGYDVLTDVNTSFHPLESDQVSLIINPLDMNGVSVTVIEPMQESLGVSIGGSESFNQEDAGNLFLDWVEASEASSDVLF
ncbi:hypothetical protein sync_0711 [Synechococcus sp. CC9311]|nr:hypothetical protein sync_0711 [Synechococcus sp. CC9311]